MMEVRYKLYAMNGKSYEIDEDDLNKLKANAGEMLVQLKQVMIHPSSISAIEPYHEPYRGMPIQDGDHYRLGEPQPPRPLLDLFNNSKLLNDKN